MAGTARLCSPSPWLPGGPWHEPPGPALLLPRPRGAGTRSLPEPRAASRVACAPASQRSRSEGAASDGDGGVKQPWGPAERGWSRAGDVGGFSHAPPELRRSCWGRFAARPHGTLRPWGARLGHEVWGLQPAGVGAHLLRQDAGPDRGHNAGKRRAVSRDRDIPHLESPRLGKSRDPAPPAPSAPSALWRGCSGDGSSSGSSWPSTCPQRAGRSPAPCTCLARGVLPAAACPRAAGTRRSWLCRASGSAQPTQARLQAGRLRARPASSCWVAGASRAALHPGAGGQAHPVITPQSSCRRCPGREGVAGPGQSRPARPGGDRDGKKLSPAACEPPPRTAAPGAPRWSRHAAGSRRGRAQQLLGT